VSGLRKVVDAQGLEIATGCGWVMVESYDFDREVFSSETIPVQPAYPGAPVTSTSCRTLLARDRRFVVEMAADSALAKMAADRDAAFMVSDKSRAEAREAEAKAERAERDAAEKQRTIDSLREQQKLSIERNAKLSTAVEKMERDLGKVRREVGEARLRDILAEAKS
jgi:hypothetical protein